MIKLIHILKDIVQEHQVVNLNELEIVDPDDFKNFIRNFKNYLDGLSQKDMYDSTGHYNSTLKSYFNELKRYSREGSEEEKMVADFALSWFLNP